MISHDPFLLWYLHDSLNISHECPMKNLPKSRIQEAQESNVISSTKARFSGLGVSIALVTCFGRDAGQGEKV